PPGTVRKRSPRMVSPGPTKRGDWVTRSMLMLPTTTIRLMRAPRRTGFQDESESLPVGATSWVRPQPRRSRARAVLLMPCDSRFPIPGQKRHRPRAGSCGRDSGRRGAAEAAGVARQQRRRRAGHGEQGLGVAVFHADGGDFVPAEERDLAHPLRVGAELLHVEAVVLDADQ